MESFVILMLVAMVKHYLYCIFVSYLD